jgi:hypothetical protein
MNTLTASRPLPLRAIFRWALGSLAIAFGVATLFEGGHVLFGGPAARAAAGKFVPFVLLFNFTAAFAYIATGVSTLLRRGSAIWVARAIALSTLLVFVALGIHVLTGGAHETHTLIAMTLRSGFWTAQALLLPRVLDGKPPARA